MVRFTKIVDAIVINDKSFKMDNKRIAIRGSSDMNGKSLTLSDEEADITIVIQLEPIMNELRMMLGDRG